MLRQEDEKESYTEIEEGERKRKGEGGLKWQTWKAPKP